MRPERASRLDHWIRSNWLSLPIEARDGIAFIFLTKCEKGLNWPHQVMQNAVALLGKSVTDERPISLTSLLYAVYVNIKKPAIAEFDLAHATWWDSAVAGNFRLRDGIRRRFVSEVACLKGNCCGDTFYDLEKFYDSMTTLILFGKRAGSNWDHVVLYMSLLVHLSLRVLRIGDLWGEWIHPCNSILQGCGSSNSRTRALLYNLLQDLHSRFPVQFGQQVDDINRHSHGTFSQSVRWSVEATCMLDKGLSALGLTLSQNKIDHHRFTPTAAPRCTA